MTTTESEYDAGERIYIGRTSHTENVALHIERYRLALAFIPEGAVVLDAASGSGYGSELLSHRARRVVGLEISDHALQHAMNHHSRANIEYRQADLNRSIALPDGYFDAIVSFETLEHVANPDHMLSEFHRLLKPGGSLVLSTPDRIVNSALLGDRNAFHVNELSRAELIELISQQFTIRALYGQVAYAPAAWQTLLRWMLRLDIFKVRRRLATIRIVQSMRRAMRPVNVASGGANITELDANNQRAYVFLIVNAVKP